MAVSRHDATLRNNGPVHHFPGLNSVRVAHDCVPPLRMAALRTVHAHPGNSTTELARLMDKPRSSVDRALQELHLLDLLSVTSYSADNRWRYAVAAEVDGTALADLLAGSRGFTRKVTTQALRHKEAPATRVCTSTDFSGETRPTPAEALT